MTTANHGPNLRPKPQAPMRLLQPACWDSVTVWANVDLSATPVQQLGSKLSLTWKRHHFWRHFHYKLHRKLSFWQLPVQPVMKISSKIAIFLFHKFSDVNDNYLIKSSFQQHPVQSLAAPEVVILTTSRAANDENFIKNGNISISQIQWC